MSTLSTLTLPVRWWSDQQTFGLRDLALPVEHTAFVLVDCDGLLDDARYDTATKVHAIAPALQAARQCGVRIMYFHNAPGGEGGPTNANRELHGLREGKERRDPPGWKPVRPVYAPLLQPHDRDAEFQKAHRNGFRDTFADQYLRTWSIDTLIMVGFSLKSCLYHTAVGAYEHNYRVIVLRDGVCPPGTKEYPDTIDPSNPEGGWMRYVTLRLIESNIGYTSTAADFIDACTYPHKKEEG